MSPEKRWILFGILSLSLLLAFIVWTPKKEDYSRLWKKKLTAIEYDGSQGSVKLEKAAGWFEDRFFISFVLHENKMRRPASPAVKGIFAEFETPLVKGEYVLTESEVDQRFSGQKCIRLIENSSVDTLCSGMTQNALTPVRLLEEPLRIYLLPDHIFNRLNTDPMQYVERRLLVLPSGTVPDQIRIQSRTATYGLIRSKKTLPAPDGTKSVMTHWNLKKSDGTEKEIPQSVIMSLLSSLYDLQRDQLVNDVESLSEQSMEERYSIELDLVVEGPATGGALQRSLGDRTLKLEILNPTGADSVLARIDGFTDIVTLDRIDRFEKQLSILTQASR